MTGRRRPRDLPRGALLLLAALAAAPACDTREAANPLDPANPETGGVPPNLAALAGDREVELAFDLLGLQGIEGFRLHRWVEGGDTAEVAGSPFPGDARSHRDTSVVNGITYRYRLEYLLPPGGTPRAGVPDPATPGDERIWAIDRGSPALVRVTADGRRVRARVAVPGLATPAAVALDAEGGRLWTAQEEDPPSLALLSETGELLARRADLPAVSHLAYDPRRETLWALSRRERLVLELGPDLAERGRSALEEGGTLSDLELDPEDGSVWIADESGAVRRFDGDGEAPGIALAGAPVAVSVDPAGRGVWVCERVQRLVYFFIPVGVGSWSSRAFGQAAVEPREVAARGAGTPSPEAWVADRFGALVLLALDEPGNGVVSRTPVALPRGLVRRPGDGCWLFDGGSGALLAVSRDAARVERLVRLAGPRALAAGTPP